jgi:hypothetical protein
MAAVLAVDNSKGAKGDFTRTTPGTYKLTAQGKAKARELVAA